jgi:hypothetical protein
MSRSWDESTAHAHSWCAEGQITKKIRVNRCRASQTTWRDSNSSMILVYPSCFPREGIWHLNRHAQRRSVASLFPSFQPDNAHEAYPQTKRTTEKVSPASTETHKNTRGAYRPRGRRVPQKELASHPRGARRPKSRPNNLTTRVRHTLRQSAPQKRSLPPLRKTTMTRVGPTGPVGDAYHKKSWLRTLVVLSDQSRSQTTWQRA